MRVGIHLPQYGRAAGGDAVRRVARAAEELGFADVWVSDHIVHPAAQSYPSPYLVDPFVALTWAAASTTTIGLGTSVTVVPQYHPLWLANTTASLDALSGGRLKLGVGVGWSEAEFANLGMADRFAVRGAYLEDTIQLWRHLWSGSKEPYRGRFHQLRDFVFGPLPAQRSSLPIWIGGRNEAALALAGRLADGYHATSSSPEAFAARIPTIRDAARAAGRPMPALSSRIRLALGDPAASSDARPYAFRGDATHVRSELAKWEDAGVDFLAIWPGGASLDAYLRATEAFADIAAIG